MNHRAKAALWLGVIAFAAAFTLTYTDHDIIRVAMSAMGFVCLFYVMLNERRR